MTEFDSQYISNGTAGSLAVLFHMQEVTGSSLGQKTLYCKIFRGISHYVQGKFQETARLKRRQISIFQFFTYYFTLLLLSTIRFLVGLIID